MPGWLVEERRQRRNSKREKDVGTKVFVLVVTSFMVQVMLVALNWIELNNKSKMYLLLHNMHQSDPIKY